MERYIAPRQPCGGILAEGGGLGTWATCGHPQSQHSLIHHGSRRLGVFLRTAKNLLDSGTPRSLVIDYDYIIVQQVVLSSPAHWC